MKHLFNDDDRYTQEAQDLHAEVSNAIVPIIKKYSDMGYSVRDIQYVVQGAGFDACLDIMIGKGNI